MNRRGNGGGINMRGGITTEMLEQRGLVWAERPAQTHVQVIEICPSCLGYGFVPEMDDDGYVKMVDCPRCHGKQMRVVKEYDMDEEQARALDDHDAHIDERI